MKRSWTFFGFVFCLACSNNSETIERQKLEALEEVVLTLENESKIIASDLKSIGDFYEDLIENQDTVDFNKAKKKYTFNGAYSTNRSDGNERLSSVIIYDLATDWEKALREVEITNPLDSIFEAFTLEYGLIAQIYSNSSSHISRVYPSFDAKNLIETDLDVTSFNFFYEANEENNPTRGPVSIPEIYIDPAGRGWIVSLVHPVYHQDSLLAVLGIDFQITGIFESYLEDFEGDYIVVTGNGDLVTGTAGGIESLSLPPLKNHIYKETISMDNFRISEFNLFNSKSRYVREMAQEIILNKENRYSFDGSEGIQKALAVRFDSVDWYIIELLK